MNFTKSFNLLSRKDADIAGGKGASLGELTQAGIPVPPGFVVLSGAFNQFIHETGLAQDIDSALAMVNRKEIHTVESASEQIKGFILSREIPEDIASEIQRHYKDLDRDFGAKYVAVRSSATAEDGADHAWAGQLDSYLNTTEPDLLDNVKRCWASLYTPRAIFYRLEKGLADTKISVAVVVQKMVESECSGIAFSVHPVSEDRNRLIIEAGFGLGEAVVSGQITPDSYVVEKSPRNIIDISVNTQDRGLYLSPDGGNEWRNIPDPKASSQVLDEAQILELSELVIKIENHYGFPCDIEWAMEAGAFYIVQSRPITTLKNNSDISDTTDIEQRIASEEMVSLGSRKPDTLEARLKIIGWSTNFKKEFGVGYRIMVINSEGKQFGDRKSMLETDEYFLKKDAAFAREYMEKMAKLNADLVERIRAQPEKDFTGELSYLLTYFSVVRWVIENVYEDASEEDQKHIDAWRNDKALFSSLDAHDKNHPIEDLAEWSLVSIDGVITQLDKVLTCKIASNTMPGDGDVGNGDVADGSASEIKGKVGYPGVVRGRARVALTKEIRDAISEGDIIVAPMTTLDFLPAMAKAAAFVTDEGGVTCHAAIVAREMKKPCIIGTRTGTQVIKDGDVIEVDADKGTVRVLKTTSGIFNKDDYTLSFWARGVSVFVTDIHLDVYKRLEVLYIIDDGMFKQYFTKAAYDRALDEGVKFYADAHAFAEYKAELSSHCDMLKEFYETKLRNKETIRREGAAAFFQHVTKLCGEHAKMNFEYTDKAFAHQEENSIIKNNLQGVAQFKDVVRTTMNTVLFEPDGHVACAFKILGKQLGVSPAILDNLTQKEILDLFDGIMPDESKASKRQEAFVESYNLDIFYEGQDAQRIINQFKEEPSRAEVIHGQVANKGKARGKVKIIPVDYGNLERVHYEIEKMEMGDILVAETTAPELIVACKKAGAIVTDMGGLMSHAAIVSREFKIPCVVGTQNASKILRNGDIVEVDADNGLVRILK
jgi:phosphoenolpyruvate synthase/pyruvate phosphate dikinase